MEIFSCHSSSGDLVQSEENEQSIQVKDKVLKISHHTLYTHKQLNYVHLSSTNQPIRWQQLDAFRHVDVVVTICPQFRQHQNEEERRFKAPLYCKIVPSGLSIIFMQFIAK